MPVRLALLPHVSVPQRTVSVLIASPHRGGAVKIADFGLARGVESVVTGGCGTPAYMAPECFTSDLMEQQEYDDTAGGSAGSALPLLDVYALGIILWELWTKRPPWGVRSPHRILLLVTNGKRPPHVDGGARRRAGSQRGSQAAGSGGAAGEKASCCNGADPAMPPALSAWVEACWAQAPGDRPPTGGAALALFEAEVVPELTGFGVHIGGGSAAAAAAASVEEALRAQHEAHRAEQRLCRDQEEVAAPSTPPGAGTTGGRPAAGAAAELKAMETYRLQRRAAAQAAAQVTSPGQRPLAKKEAVPSVPLHERRQTSQVLSELTAEALPMAMEPFLVERGLVGEAASKVRRFLTLES